MLCPGGIVCIVLSLVHGHCEKLPELCLKTELSQLNQGWTSHAWQDEIKDVKTNIFYVDNLFSISYNSNFQSSACSSRNLLISLSRSFLISSGTIWLPFGATSYMVFSVLGFFLKNFYLDQVLYCDLVEAALLHHVLADPLNLVLPAALLQPLDQLGVDIIVESV